MHPFRREPVAGSADRTFVRGIRLKVGHAHDRTVTGSLPLRLSVEGSVVVLLVLGRWVWLSGSCRRRWFHQSIVSRSRA
jgi:hypothetical protein